ncbi:MAG: hypothetical protein V9E85_07215 [Candidatus Nanopelagicales bacterium]
MSLPFVFGLFPGVFWPDVDIASELTPGFQVQLFLLFEVRVFSGMAATPPVRASLPPVWLTVTCPTVWLPAAVWSHAGTGAGRRLAGVDVACTQPHDARLDCVNERPDTDKGKVMPPGKDFD